MNQILKKAKIDTNLCVACGNCAKYCPRSAIAIVQGRYAKVSVEQCVGCGLCQKACPASVIEIKEAVK